MLLSRIDSISAWLKAVSMLTSLLRYFVVDCAIDTFLLRTPGITEERKSISSAFAAPSYGLAFIETATKSSSML
jgi:hypothetical protein